MCRKTSWTVPERWLSNFKTSRDREPTLSVGRFMAMSPACLPMYFPWDKVLAERYNTNLHAGRVMFLSRHTQGRLVMPFYISLNIPCSPYLIITTRWVNSLTRKTSLPESLYFSPLIISHFWSFPAIMSSMDGEREGGGREGGEEMRREGTKRGRE